MHIVINASAASAGGGLTYLRNVVPHFSARPHLRTTVLAARGFLRDFKELPGVTLLETEEFGGKATNRFWREQIMLPGLIRGCGADVLISAGNIALFRSPVPQILLTRNALYTSTDFYADAWARRDIGLWIRMRLQGFFAKWSVCRADRVVTPSESFAEELRAWLGKKSLPISVIPHGFDTDRFFGSDEALPTRVQSRLPEGNRCLRLLFVSHYNYFRNFDTLIRALPLLKSLLPDKPVKLVLTCRLRPAPEWGPYDPTRTESLARGLGAADDIVELDLVPYPSLHKVYRACDIYVNPSYAESFAHPLVEAMACGLPVVASDLPVHREVCGDAALYFPRFSPETLAERIAGIACSPEIALELGARGRARSRNYSWKKHADQLISLAANLIDGCNEKSLPALSYPRKPAPLRGSSSP